MTLDGQQETTNLDDKYSVKTLIANKNNNPSVSEYKLFQDC
jgi:hypothetical protein